ncbi:MAG: Gfo/Idh/MocA family oxidoreductase [bacterium]
MKRLRAAVIGLGVGEQHIEGYESHPGCEVTTLCDFDDEKAAEAEKKYPDKKTVKDADEVLEDPEIDVVSITTYDNYHAGQVVKALKNGKHVFVEKPLCLYEDEARQIRAILCEKPELKISSNLILRMSPRFRLLKKIIREKELGEIFYMEGDYNYGRIHKITEGWRGRLDFYSVVYGGGVHIIDLLLWLTGDSVEEVKAYGTRAARDSDFKYNDTVVSILKFRSGAVGKMTCNFACVHPHFHCLSLYGDKATFINGLENGFLYTSRDAGAKPKSIDAPYPGTRKGDLIHSFVESILTGIESGVTQDEIFDCMSVCFAIEKSVNKSDAVKVEYI